MPPLRCIAVGDERKMTRSLLITSLIAIVGAAGVSAQEPPAGSELGAPKLALVNLPAKRAAKL